MNHALRTEYDMDNELYDLRSIFRTMVKGGLDKQTRDNIGVFLAQYMRENIHSHHQFVDHRGFGPVYTENDLKLLNEMGVVSLDDIFTDSEINHIIAYLSDFPVKCVYGDSTSPLEKLDICSVDEVPLGVNLGFYEQEVVSRCPWFYKIAHNENLIRLVEAYLGVLPTLSSITVWWSFSTGMGLLGNQLYHHDRADFRSVNLFVYLNDVGPNNGPHVYVKRTHEFRVLYEMMRRRLDSDSKGFQKFWRWMETHRKSDKDVETIFTEAEIKRHVGIKGTSFLEDTRGLHKGQFPVEGRRLVFELCYNCLNIMILSTLFIVILSVTLRCINYLRIVVPIILIVCFITSVDESRALFSVLSFLIYRFFACYHQLVFVWKGTNFTLA